MMRKRTEIEQCSIVSKEDFGDPSMYNSCSPLDWLSIVAEKAVEKEREIAKVDHDRLLPSTPSSPEKLPRIVIRVAKKKKIQHAFDLNSSPEETDESDDMSSCCKGSEGGGSSESSGEVSVLPSLDITLVEERPLPGFDLNVDDQRKSADDKTEKVTKKTEVVQTEVAKVCSKKRRNSDCNDQEHGNVAKKPKHVVQETRPEKGVESATPTLPQEVMEKVKGMGGKEPSLLIELAITTADMNKDWGRLALEIPASGLKLTGQEKEDMRAWDARKKEMAGLNVRVIEPRRRGEEVEVSWLNLKRWNNLSCFVFMGNWNDLRQRHQLKVGDVLQVWSFRVTAGKALCFAFVKLN